MTEPSLGETPLEADVADVLEQQTPVDPDAPGSEGAPVEGERVDPEDVRPVEDDSRVPLEADEYDVRDQHRTVDLGDDGEAVEDTSDEV